MTRLASLTLLTTALLATAAPWAQDYPSRPLRIVTPGTGGSSDVISRLIAQGLSARLGQQAVVDNRPSGVIPGEIVAHAQPDGYTMLVTGSSHWLAQYLQERTPYDAAKDFAPITLAVSSPNLLVAHPSVATSVKQLIDRARTNPGKLNYASIAVGSSTHLAAELFKSMAHVDIVRVPYKATGAALTDLLSGQVQIMFSAAAGATPHVKAGRLLGLGVTTVRPSALAPGIPTVAEAGLPGYESIAIFGMFAPANTPRPIVQRVNREVVSVLNLPEVRDKFLAIGVEAVGSSPAAFGAAVQAEMVRYGKIIKDAGIRGE